MKKTLITLAAFAMASVASADWTTTPTASFVQNINQGGTVPVYTLNAYTFEFTIESTDLTATNTAILAYVNGGLADGNKNTQVTFTLTADSNGTFTLQGGRSNTTTEASSISWSSSQTITGITAGTYTLSTTSGNPATFAVTNGDGVTKTSASYENQVVFASGVSTPTTGFNNTFAVVKTDTPTESVPEPTTATLSLLALAGLAARRRRK